MLDFIVKNYYVILVVCILLIFAIIGYIIDTLRTRKFEENENAANTYIPEEEVFIQKFEEPSETDEYIEEENVDDLLKKYNQVKEENDSN